MKQNQEPKYDAVQCEDGVIRLQNRASKEFISDVEPVFILRARDIHAIDTLKYYLQQVKDEHHKQVISSRIKDFGVFERVWPERMKEPDTDKSFPL